MKHQHGFYLALKELDLDTNETREIVPTIKDNLMTSEARSNFQIRNKIFNGKVGYYDDLLTQTYAVNDRYFIFNSISAG